MVVPLILKAEGPVNRVWGSPYDYAASDEEVREKIGLVKDGVIFLSPHNRQEYSGRENYITLYVKAKEQIYNLFVFDQGEHNLLLEAGEVDYIFQKNSQAFQYYTDKIRSLRTLPLDRADKRTEYPLKFRSIQKLISDRQFIADWLIDKGYVDVIISYLKDVEFILSDRFDFSDDFATVIKDRKYYHLTPMQAGVIQLLAYHIERDMGLRGQYLLEQVDSAATRLRDLFKGNSAAFKDLIRYDNKKRIYKINLM